MTAISLTVSYAAVQDRLGLTFSGLLGEGTSGAVLDMDSIVDLTVGQAHGSKERVSGSDRQDHQDDKDDQGESELFLRHWKVFVGLWSCVFLCGIARQHHVRLTTLA